MRVLLALMMLLCHSLAFAAPVDDVMAADRAFAALAKVKGARAAFTAYADADAVMFRDGVGPIKGVEAIGRAFREPPAATPEWEPLAAEVAASGDLAYSWGSFKWTAVADGPMAGNPPVTGYYVSVWKKQRDGGWKWVIDLGVTAPVKPQ
jgi:ketosteroid isomerase-like protein